MIRHRRSIVAALLAVAACAAIAMLGPWSLRPVPFDPETCCTDVAHAGGAYRGEPYTNAREALEASRRAGRTLLELDFLETADGHVVLAHDWNAFEGAAPTLAQFRAARADLTRLTLAELVAWLREACADCRVVADPKMPLDAFWSALARAMPAAERRSRIVPQVYSPAQARAFAAAEPGQPMILTLYRLREIADDDLRALAAVPQLLAITMPIGRVRAMAPRVRRLTGKPVLVHGPREALDAGPVRWIAWAHGANGFYRH